MFLIAISSPHRLYDGTEFDGKIGIHAIVTYVEAKRVKNVRVF